MKLTIREIKIIMSDITVELQDELNIIDELTTKVTGLIADKASLQQLVAQLQADVAAVSGSSNLVVEDKVLLDDIKARLISVLNIVNA